MGREKPNKIKQYKKGSQKWLPFFNIYYMKHICEYKSYYNVDDIILIEYWYNDMLTACKIVEKIGRKYKISHNIEQSKIKNAPDELISPGDIIDLYRNMKKKQ